MKPSVPTQETYPRDPEQEGWIHTAIEAGEDKLASQSEAYFVGDVMGITDWFVVTSASNVRQVRAVAENIEEELAAIAGMKPLFLEGLDAANWVLMDYGSFVVHIFTDEARDFYDIDRLWSDVPKIVPKTPSRA